jgi:hypothetical protein
LTSIQVLAVFFKVLFKAYHSDTSMQDLKAS